MSVFKYILIGTGAFLGLRYLKGMNRISKKAVIDITGKVDKVTIEGVVVILKYNIKNPARTSINLTPPLIKIIHQGQGKENILASSSMALVDIPEETKDRKGRIRIPPFNETGAITTRILIPHLKMIGLGSGLIARLKDPTQKVNFMIETNATLFTAIGSFPYDHQTTIAL
ncbi:MAG: hypothetical protein N4A35_17090 [Flavobacteriales bacterium]|jgi:hypothetical protein|nr:hypothetical protein [Flavobacteriales bacterium]